MDIVMTKDDRVWIEETITGKISGLKKDVSGLKKDVSGLKKDVSGLKKDVSGLKKDVSGLRSEMLDSRGEMGKMEARIEDKAQKRHRELMRLFDGLAKEVKDGEEFRLVTNHRLDRLEDIVGVTD